MEPAKLAEIRRHALRFLVDATDGSENSRVLLQMLNDYGHALTWREFDGVLTYLERAGLVTFRWLEREISRVRIVSITGLGLQVYEGTAADPGVLPPSQRQR